MCSWVPIQGSVSQQGLYQFKGSLKCDLQLCPSFACSRRRTRHVCFLIIFHIPGSSGAIAMVATVTIAMVEVATGCKVLKNTFKSKKTWRIFLFLSSRWLLNFSPSCSVASSSGTRLPQQRYQETLRVFIAAAVNHSTYSEAASLGGFSPWNGTASNWWVHNLEYWR